MINTEALLNILIVFIAVDGICIILSYLTSRR